MNETHSPFRDHSEHKPPARDTKSLLDLHIAEYNALTARNTQWSVIQSNVWILFIIALTLMATFWEKHPELVNLAISLTGVVAQGVLIGLCFATMEIYRNVYYIEGSLRRSIQALVLEEDFWRYEQFLFERSGRKPWWSDAAAAGVGLLFLVAVVLALLCYGQGTLARCIGIAFNFLCFVALAFQTHTLTNERQKFEEVIKSRVSSDEPLQRTVR